MQPTVFTADFIAPIDQPLIRDAALSVADGQVIAVGPAREISRRHPDFIIRELGNVVLLPGLINPHTHLELTLTECRPRDGATFVQWLHAVRQRSRDDTGDAVREGVRQSLRFGVTTIGDITQQIHETRSTLAAIQRRPRVVSFGEAIGLAKRRARFDQLLAEAIQTEFESTTLRIGLSPHAPYTVDLHGYQQCLQVARQRKLPIATHLAEQHYEQEFLQFQTGPFRELWEQIGSWEEPVETYRGRPIGFAAAVGLLDYPSLLAHVNFCSDDELATLSRGQASVVYCPRTHRYFDHPPHRWRQMLNSGINVVAGTDSCASSPDLNLVDELRLLRQIAPEVPSITLWQMATTNAAKALRCDDSTGSLAPGKHADFVAFVVRSSDPLSEILTSPIKPIATWIAGELAWSPVSP